MFPIKTKMRLVGSALGIGIDKDSVICVDNFYNVSRFSKEDYVIDKALQLGKDLESLHHFSKAVAVSYGTSKVAMGFAKATKGIVINTTPEIAPIAQLTWQKLQISKIAYSCDDSLLATGGEDGRVLVYSADNYQLVFSLPPLPDTISSIVFSEDDSLIFSASFDKNATIFNSLKNTQVATLKVEYLIEDAFFYAENTKLFCVTKEGKALIYNITEDRIESEIFLQGAWLTICHKLPEEDFAIVGGKDKQLRIIRLSDNVLIESITLEQSGITTMRFDKNLLYIGYSDGVVEIVDIDAAREEMLELLNKDDLKGALSVIQEKNIFLKTMRAYCEKLESQWKEALAKAIDLLAKDQMQEATAVIEPFMLDKAKKEEFDYYWQQKEFTAKFMDALEAKNYAEAYRLSEQHSYLKDTIAYEEVENLWNKTFEVCKRLLFQDPKGNLAKAQDLLRPFALAKCKKDSVMMLLRNSDKYVQADKEYRAKNFVEYFKMTERFPFLKDVLIYKSALFIGDQIVQRINALENQTDFAKALEMCKLLASMAPFKNIANSKIETIQLKQNFSQACSENKLSEAFKLAEEHYELRSMPEYKILYDTFKEHEKIAFSFAVVGNGKNVLDHLKDYLHIDCWIDKIAAILKIAYLAEFSKNAPGKEGALENISWKETFQYYIERYGKDEELKKVVYEMGLQNELDSIPFDGNPKGYLSTIIADSLLSINEQPLHQHEEEGK
ncbi:WD40 repeat domain-containing protein [Helicobacter sp.]|uniref:WD40 repeat domain-containing protein n=1 Tax=Helicobacter sp. TaxID=218 RepID=UPI0025C6DCB6|nr:WD40 repeat domain-containing protein [Helicobacter sp.]MCI5968843.1 WD40 repeat domain-containing protein [Helicobacter sp.]MDY2585028.1 WD40 repeat domain-containing protein [Helicobacter sp.]